MNRRPILRYELLVWKEFRGKGDASPKVERYSRRGDAEKAADAAHEQYPNGDMQVWAVLSEEGDDQFLVYKLEPAPDGVLTTRLRERLRHGRPMTARQFRALNLVAQSASKWVDEAELRAAIGAYATQCIVACHSRGWLTPRAGKSGREFSITDDGRRALEQYTDAAAAAGEVGVLGT